MIKSKPKMLSKVYTEKVERQYYASTLSCASCFNFCTIASIVIVPFIIGAMSNEFYIKTNSFREQPDTQFMYNAIFTMDVMDTISSEWKTLTWSTSDALNTVLQSTYRPQTLRVAQIDFNDDGRNEVLNFMFDMPLNENEVAHSVTSHFFMDSRFSRQTSYKLESLVTIEYDHSAPGTGFYFEGDLQFYQRDPISTSGGIQEPLSLEHLFNDDSEVVSAGAFDMKEIFAKHQSFDNRFVVKAGDMLWERDASMGKITRHFKTNITLHIPEVTITYTPDASETMKFAWIQYLALSIITTFFINFFRKFVFENNVFETTVILKNTLTTNKGDVNTFQKNRHNF